MRINYGKFAIVVSYLKRNIPPAYPVSARRMYGLAKDTMADVELAEKNGKKKFVIRISRKLGNDIAVLMLLHEWAHALCWQIGKKIECPDHGAEWGVAYSRVYQTFEGYLDQ